MTEIILCVVIVALLLHNFSLNKTYLNHLKELERQLANLGSEDKVATPNDIRENHYRDISEVNPNEIIK